LRRHHEVVRLAGPHLKREALISARREADRCIANLAATERAIRAQQ